MRELKGGRKDGRGEGEMRCERRDNGSKRDVRARKRVRKQGVLGERGEVKSSEGWKVTGQ